MGGLATLKIGGRVGTILHEVPAVKPEWPSPIDPIAQEEITTQFSNTSGGTCLVIPRNLYEAGTPKGLNVDALAANAGGADYQIATSAGPVPNNQCFYIDGISISWQLYNPAGVAQIFPLNIDAFVVVDMQVIHANFLRGVILPPSSALGDNYVQAFPPKLARPGSRVQLFLGIAYVGGNIGAANMVHYQLHGKMVKLPDSITYGGQNKFYAAPGTAAMDAALLANWTL